MRGIALENHSICFLLCFCLGAAYYNSSAGSGGFMGFVLQRPRTENADVAARVSVCTCECHNEEENARALQFPVYTRAGTVSIICTKTAPSEPALLIPYKRMLKRKKEITKNAHALAMITT